MKRGGAGVGESKVPGTGTRVARASFLGNAGVTAAINMAQKRWMWNIKAAARRAWSVWSSVLITHTNQAVTVVDELLVLVSTRLSEAGGLLPAFAPLITVLPRAQMETERTEPLMNPTVCVTDRTVSWAPTVPVAVYHGRSQRIWVMWARFLWVTCCCYTSCFSPCFLFSDSFYIWYLVIQIYL